MATHFLRMALCSLAYAAVRLGLPALRLGGFRQKQVGRCTLWAPKGKMAQIEQGLAYLGTADPELHRRLTCQGRIVFFYAGSVHARCEDVFTISDSFMSWGEAGVACCLLEAVLLLDEEAQTLQQVRARLTREAGRQMSSRVVQKVYAWAREHSVPEEIVGHYRGLLNLSPDADTEP